jgi:hypothetical protein
MIDDAALNSIREYFKKNNYVVIRGFLDSNTATLFYNYCINKVKQVDFLTTHAKADYIPEWDGEFGDPQAPISYSCYGDCLMDTLAFLSTETVEKYTDLKLIPEYSYWRFYQHGEELKRHRDRESCEISATLCLGYNNSNLTSEEQETYNWPMFVEDYNDVDNGLPVHLQPGDIIIYKGCELDHWREKFKGLNHAQVFIHYNDASGPYKKIFDGRPILGIPKKYQSI